MKKKVIAVSIAFVVIVAGALFYYFGIYQNNKYLISNRSLTLTNEGITIAAPRAITCGTGKDASILLAVDNFKEAVGNIQCRLLDSEGYINEYEFSGVSYQKGKKEAYLVFITAVLAWMFRLQVWRIEWIPTKTAPNLHIQLKSAVTSESHHSLLFIDQFTFGKLARLKSSA